MEDSGVLRKMVHDPGGFGRTAFLPWWLPLLRPACDRGSGSFGPMAPPFHPELTRMHRLSSKRAVLNLRMAALCLLGFLAFALVVPILLVVSFVTSDRMMSVYALWGGAVGALVYVCYLLFASGVRCPLCHVRMIARNLCSINRRAKRTLGSHRLRVACGVLFMNCFRCPYCGEATEVRARDRSGRSRRRHSF